MFVRRSFRPPVARVALLAATLAWCDQLAAGATVAVRAPPSESDTLALVTLRVWAEDLWLDVLDREGTIRGHLAEEGIFQRFHPLMDDEYALDVRTGLFSPADDARWAVADEGLRVVGSSISHPHIMNRLDWRQAFPVTASVELTADYRRDHSLTDRRDHPRIGVRWLGAGGSAWTVWGQIGVHFHKPAADVEVGAARSWPLGATGLLDLDVRIAALDAFSDVVFVGLGVDPADVEAHLDHARPPLAARTHLELRGHRARLELVGGATTSVEARVDFPGGHADPFHLSERVIFAGALLEVTPTPGLTVAGYARGARAATRHERDPPTAPPAGSLQVLERTGETGLLARRRLGGALVAEAEAHAVWRPEARVDREGSLRHDDHELFWSAALARRPLAGWEGRLAYTGMDRTAGALLPGVDGTHHRLVTETGWRSATGFHVVVGLRWDLDDFGRHPFDGGHLRLSAIPGARPRS